MFPPVYSFIPTHRRDDISARFIFLEAISAASWPRVCLLFLFSSAHSSNLLFCLLQHPFALSRRSFSVGRCVYDDRRNGRVACRDTHLARFVEIFVHARRNLICRIAREGFHFRRVCRQLSDISNRKRGELFEPTTAGIHQRSGAPISKAEEATGGVGRGTTDGGIKPSSAIWKYSNRL